MLQATFGHSHSEQLLQKRGPEVPNRCAEILDVDCDFTGPIFFSDSLQLSYCEARAGISPTVKMHYNRPIGQ